MRILLFIAGLFVAGASFLIYGSTANVDAIAALPISPNYYVRITGGERQADGSVAPYYTVHTSIYAYQEHGGTIVDIGDIRVLYPDDCYPYGRETHKAVVEDVIMETNRPLASRARRGSHGSNNLSISRGFVGDTNHCQVQVRDMPPTETLWSLDFTVRGRELTLFDQTFEIGTGHRVIYLDIESKIERVERLNHELAVIDMSEVTEFEGTWEALREIRGARSRGGF